MTFIDYGNKDTVSFAGIRPLDPKFRGLSGQAHDARLRCVFGTPYPYRGLLPARHSSFYLNGWPTIPLSFIVKLVHHIDTG